MGFEVLCSDGEQVHPHEKVRCCQVEVEEVHYLQVLLFVSEEQPVCRHAGDDCPVAEEGDGYNNPYHDPDAITEQFFTRIERVFLGDALYVLVIGALVGRDDVSA